MRYDITYVASVGHNPKRFKVHAESEEGARFHARAFLLENNFTTGAITHVIARKYRSRGRGHGNTSYLKYLFYKDVELIPCAHCGDLLNREQATMDRIIPGSQGGTYMLVNIAVACRTCNECRGNSEFWSYREFSRYGT